MLGRSRISLVHAFAVLAFVVMTLPQSTLGAMVAAVTSGDWTLYPDPPLVPSASAVEPPIKADGSSSYRTAPNTTVPLKFALIGTSGPMVFQSIYSDGTSSMFPGTDDFSFLSFEPDSNAPLTFNDIASLKADYAFTMGNCGGGSLRWTVRVALGHGPGNAGNVFIYYGDLPNFTDCTTTNQSGVNMIGLGDLRYDTSQVGGMFYDTYAHASTLVGNLRVVRVSLDIDSGWAAGDQKLNVSNVSVNDNTFSPDSGGGKLCDLPPADLQITKISGSGPLGDVPPPPAGRPHGVASHFDIVACKYMYDVPTTYLYGHTPVGGPGVYKFEVVVNGTPLPGGVNVTLQ